MSWSPGNPEKFDSTRLIIKRRRLVKYLLSTDVSGPTAKVWALYVKQAEAGAKEEADSRNSHVDTLFVFAGLFAGVVSSFVIESRTTLQPNPEPILLANILSSLDKESWGFSDTHLASTTRAGAASVALFLFLLGLVIECLGDNAGIGWSILALVALTFIGYGVITILPWLFPGCPLRTPISEVGAILLQSQFWKQEPSSNGQSGRTGRHRPAVDAILKLWKGNSFVDAPSGQIGRDQPSVAKGAILKFWKEEPSDDILWMDILSWMLTNSVEVEGVEEGVKVFAAIELKGRVREGLDPRVPKTLCDRLNQCFKVASENIEDLERTDACLQPSYAGL
ncbi:hypothetical protein PILCRDRAFT_2256 [Piloderma croceum F 1598]|uniref:DUF6535 domain-containing protein n=1 Tax=Piloderma croceum (strain F 1598) TaxID=765440 RepID=A0A0C3GHA1_PILCF|nr:hypothetical protein PILCRDRAFT_2256 [Piloderma croceum F 1598]